MRFRNVLLVYHVRKCVDGSSSLLDVELVAYNYFILLILLYVLLLSYLVKFYLLLFLVSSSKDSKR